MSHMQKRIEKGMELLDRVVPDWYYRVKINDLNIQHERYCVLGKCFGSFNNGCDKLNIKSNTQAYKYGFLSFSGLVIPVFLFEKDWFFYSWNWGKKLTDAWKQAIEDRRIEDELRYTPKLVDDGIEIG